MRGGGSRTWIIAIAIGIASPAVADTCSSSDDVGVPSGTSASSIDPPESTGCAVRPGVGALTSLGMSILALGLASRRRSKAMT
ncbi:MAG: hypothetical protein ACKV2T_42725 [Kofleriaceae bacterium]